MVDGGLSHLGPLPNTHLKSCLEVGRPTLDSPKGPVMVGRPIVEDTYGARARGGCREEVCGCPNRADFGLHQDLSPLTPNTKVLTDEALMEEASRYIGSHSRSFFSLEKRVFSYSSFLSGLDRLFVATDGGCSRGCSSKIVGGIELGPLRMILVDGREVEVSGLLRLANETTEEKMENVLDRAPHEIMEEGNEVGELSWQSSCLAKFSRCLGMPMECFEVEILFMLKRMKEMKV